MECEKLFRGANKPRACSVTGREGHIRLDRGDTASLAQLYPEVCIGSTELGGGVGVSDRRHNPTSPLIGRSLGAGAGD